MKKHIYISVTNDLVSDQRIHRIASVLSESQATVTLIGRKLNESPDFSSELFKIKRFKLLFQKGFLFYATFNIRLFFYLVTRKYCNFLVANDLDTLPANFLVSKLRKTKIIYDSHEYFTESPELVHRKKIQKFWLYLEKLLLPRVKFAYTVNSSLASIYSSLYNVNFRVIRNVPLLNKKIISVSIPEKLNGKKIIIYQGAVNLGRGIENVLLAMKNIPEIAFIIAGYGDIYPDIQKMVTQMNLNKRVYLTGRLLPEQLAGLTPQCDIGISPELNMGKNYYYALPNKLFSYMHAGIPVLTSDFPEMRKIVEKNDIGLTFESSNLPDLINKIEYMITNKEKIEKWKKNALEAAKIYCWENEQKELKMLYTKVGLKF